MHGKEISFAHLKLLRIEGKIARTVKEVDIC